LDVDDILIQCNRAYGADVLTADFNKSVINVYRDFLWRIAVPMDGHPLPRRCWQRLDELKSRYRFTLVEQIVVLQFVQPVIFPPCGVDLTTEIVNKVGEQPTRAMLVRPCIPILRQTLRQ